MAERKQCKSGGTGSETVSSDRIIETCMSQCFVFLPVDRTLHLNPAVPATIKLSTPYAAICLPDRTHKKSGNSAGDGTRLSLLDLKQGHFYMHVLKGEWGTHINTQTYSYQV